MCLDVVDARLERGDILGDDLVALAPETLLQQALPVLDRQAEERTDRADRDDILAERELELGLGDVGEGQWHGAEGTIGWRRKLGGVVDQ